jgi:fructosamine-3-kinase
METETKQKGDNASTEIIFKNQPKLSEHEVDQKFNQRRLELIPYVEKFIRERPLFQGKKVTVEIAEKGVSSLVNIIETEKDKLVLKISLSLGYSEGEAEFLKVWEEAGVKVPHVFESGKINEHSYSLMEYIDAPVLSDFYFNDKMQEPGTYFEMGGILQKMHKPKAKGFGKMVDGRAEFEKFEDWINSPDMDKRIKYIKDNNIIENAEGILGQVRNILVKALSGSVESSYCHNDFGTHNIFGTEPLTVFDPSPRFNNFYIDLGRSAQSLIAYDQLEPLDQFIAGYFKDEPYDKNVLLASIILNILYKIPYIHKTKKVSNIEKYKKYIENNKHKLI